MPEFADPANTVILASFENHSILSILKVRFAGHHVVDRDTKGTFPAPEFFSRREAQQWPVCYTRNKNVKLTPTFEVMAPPTSTETVKIKGVARLGSATLEWSGSVSVSPGDREVTASQLTSSAPLPNEVACYDPATIEWEFEPPGVAPGSAGNSANVWYVTLGDPDGTPPFWTLLDYSCRAAAGATNGRDLISMVFSPFTSRTMRRMRDGRGLTYWYPTTDSNARSTHDLLSFENGTEGNGAAGECGSWQDFLLDMYNVHGQSGVRIMVVKSEMEHARKTGGFLVKNWRFEGTGSQPAPYTHRMWWECKTRPPHGIPGQLNPNPPPCFLNHYIVRAMGNIYDPSYGGGPFFTQQEWENVAIEGLYIKPGPICGFPKSQYPNTRLVQFV